MRQPPHIRLGRRDFLQLALLAPVLPALQNAAGGIRFLEYDDAEPVVRSGKLALPPAFQNSGADAIRTSWPQWVRARDAEIRGRLQRGEEDTLANFVLFGTSFTSLPRVTPDLADPAEVERRTQARVRAFVDTVAMPGSNERLVLLSALIARLGYSTSPAARRQKLAEYILQNVNRYVTERQQYQRNPAASDLYRERGLSLDTDFRPNYAIETALAEVRRRGLLSTVRRAAIVGPGLDFIDKDSGFDHYPLQTLQPFALIDSLVRLSLSSIQGLRVSVFDISPSTLEHLSRATTRARAQQGYTLQLVLDRSRGWNQLALDYWERFATTIGAPTAPLPLPEQIQGMTRRAVGIRPDVVRTLEPMQANIVLQRARLAAAQRYDLVIATNVLIYYGAFEQALALSNVESMLSDGGVFLTNDLREEYPGVRLRPAAIVRVPYSGKQEEQVQIYSRSNFQPQLPPA